MPDFITKRSPATSDMLHLVVRWAAAHYPGLPVRQVCIHFTDVPVPICLPVAGATPPVSGAASDDAEPPKLTDLQERILDALAGKALRTDALAHKVECDRGQIFRKGGLKELRACGLVAHDEAVGYYRPDDPPPAAK